MTAQTLTVPDFRGAAARLRMLLASVVLAACFVALVRTAPSLGGPAAIAAIPSFAPTAQGTTAVASPLSDRPSGGGQIAVVPPGVPLVIAGRVDVPVGLVGHAAYWVRFEDAGAVRFGFVEARDVVVTSGDPAPLDLAGMAADGYLQPAGGALGPSAIGAPVVAGARAAPAPIAGQPSSDGVAAGPGRWLPAWMPASVARWSAEIEAVAASNRVDPALVAIVVLVESGGLPTAMSGAGATGLMQVMPGTAAEVAQRTGTPVGDAGLADARTNLALGTAYLAQMLAEFGRADDPDWQASVELAAAAYNAGPGHVGQHITTGAPLFAEAAAYREWVGGLWRERGAAVSPTLEAWKAAGGERLLAAAAPLSAMR